MYLFILKIFVTVLNYAKLLLKYIVFNVSVVSGRYFQEQVIFHRSAIYIDCNLISDSSFLSKGFNKKQFNVAFQNQDTYSV